MVCGLDRRQRACTKRRMYALVGLSVGVPRAEPARPRSDDEPCSRRRSGQYLPTLKLRGFGCLIRGSLSQLRCRTRSCAWAVFGNHIHRCAPGRWRDAVRRRSAPCLQGCRWYLCEEAAGPYRVLLRSLKKGSKVEFVRLDERLMPRADGYICVFADSALRAAGAYELALTTEGAGPDTAQNTFLMQVRFVPAR